MKLKPPVPKKPPMTKVLRAVLCITYKSRIWDSYGTSSNKPDIRPVVDGGWHDHRLTKHKAQAIVDALNKGLIPGYGKVPVKPKQKKRK